MTRESVVPCILLSASSAKQVYTLTEPYHRYVAFQCAASVRSSLREPFGYESANEQLFSTCCWYILSRGAVQEDYLESHQPSYRTWS